MLTLQLLIMRLARLIAHVRYENARLAAAVATSRKGPELLVAWDLRRELTAIDDAIERLKCIRSDAK